MPAVTRWEWSTMLLARAMDLVLVRKLLGARGRVQAWRALGADLGPGVRINSTSWMRFPAQVTIGEGTKIGSNVLLDAWGPIKIGAHCLLNEDVSLLTAQHDLDSPVFEGDTRSVTIGDYCWLPMHIRVLPGVAIGEGAVVGTGSVVTRDVPPYTVVAGNPAVIIRDRKRQAYRYGA